MVVCKYKYIIWLKVNKNKLMKIMYIFTKDPIEKKIPKRKQ